MEVQLFELAEAHINLGTKVAFQYCRFHKETFEKRDIFLSGKEGKNFNQRNTLCISRIKIRSLTPHHEKMTVLQRSHKVTGEGSRRNASALV